PLFPVLRPKLPLERAVDSKFVSVTFPHRLHHAKLSFRSESKIVEEHIHPSQRQAPTRIGAFITGQQLQNPYHRLAVHMKELLGQLDSFWSPVPFPLALVGVELEAPNAAVREQRLDRRFERGDELGTKLFRRTSAPQTQMPIRISISDEEPSIDPLATGGLSDQRYYRFF